MKMTIVLLSAVVVSSAWAQDADVNSELRAVPTPKAREEAPQMFTVERPNEIKQGNVVYSGVFVQMAKTKKLAQMFNPLAPAAAGSSEANVARNPLTGRSQGLKLFAASF